MDDGSNTEEVGSAVAPPDETSDGDDEQNDWNQDDSLDVGDVIGCGLDDPGGELDPGPQTAEHNNEKGHDSPDGV